MKRICIYAGSNSGVSPMYGETAEQLGRVMAERGIALVYGGSKYGLMGRIADTVLKHGGEVIGVMPTGLFKGEMVHTGLTELREVANMHERKALMLELSDALIALPGGLGTFEELFEAMSWSQLGIHRKPIGLLNCEQFYQPLYALVEHAIDAGFARESNRNLFVMDEQPTALVDKLAAFERPELENKWQN